ncbi:MAG: enoyl-CoA hydratase-related protein [Acidimicrobiales bacterium]
MESYSTLLVDIDEGIATIRLNRPDRLNAYTSTMSVELRNSMTSLDADDDVRVIVVTGVGRAFCAGADLSSADHFVGQSRDDVDTWAVHPWELRTPIIAAINGAAVGIGLTMTLAFDIRLVATDAKLGFVFTRRGISPEAHSTWLLPRLVGISRASELMLTGRYFSGEEAVEWGVASKHLSTGELLSHAYELAREIVENTSALSVAVAKRLLWSQLDTPSIVESMEKEKVMLEWIRRQPDSREGVASFLEHRPAKWSASKNTPFPEILK